MEEMMKEYLEMYDVMATSGDPNKMHIWGENDKWAFGQMMKTSPKIAEQWLDKNRAVMWYNYLSKAEADEIVSKFMNQDGTRGAHWSYDTFRNAVESLGATMNNAPYYNCYALWVTANMLYSDHYKSISTYVPKQDMPKFFYSMAVEKLKDADRPRFVRDYFKM